jgi:hypothetical protein
MNGLPSILEFSYTSSLSATAEKTGNITFSSSSSEVHPAIGEKRRDITRSVQILFMTLFGVSFIERFALITFQ